MKIKITILCSAMTVLAILMTTNTFAQNNKATLLVNKWYIHAYNIKNQGYPPSTKERHDFIHFKADKTFISKSEGMMEEGTYVVNKASGYIKLTDNNGESIKAFIVLIDNDTLILQYYSKELRDLEVVYKNSI
ncbi:lipocalin family protein [Aquimarina sp. MMG016]|uniref:lipocalin family protein n=1 Tax=Aquimarina sp. MMG016 TaxID=2822690 RepID=UPI001B39F2E8|nr:lipocalin family protein [Aquimarina sp. MMG016]MBQ4819322.1 lipocalin family protein [Aquimarina sp. MMG016]